MQIYNEFRLIRTREHPSTVDLSKITWYNCFVENPSLRSYGSQRRRKPLRLIPSNKSLSPDSPTGPRKTMSISELQNYGINAMHKFPFAEISFLM